MEHRNRTPWSRRDFIKAVGSTALAAGIGANGLLPGSARAEQKTLQILQWNHFVPGFDAWFNNTYVKEWGERNNTKVIVRNVGMSSLHSRAAAEISAQKGHDLCMFLSPPSVYEDQVIDHREIHEECERLYGKPIDLAVKSTYNPKTRKYYGFSDSYVPDPVNYRKDLWDDVGMFPHTWEDVRIGGRKIKQKHGIPIGIGLAPELDTNMALRSVMAAFGASVQTAESQPGLKSRQALDALKFVKALYDEAMTDEVFTWDASSNNRLMLAGRGSLTLNAISITRTGENQKIPVADRIWLAPAARGPERHIGFEHLMNVYVIWNFAKNIEGAKQFLVDYVGNFRQGFVASQFYNFPCFPHTVPDLNQLIANDPQATPRHKYKVFEDVADWVTNVGYPGYANAAIDEIFSTWMIPKMFAEVASGRMTPAAGLSQTDAAVRHIFQKWQGRGKI
ncbi:MAG: ABC transporter substrate-binding protein [Candidatus Tectomicrobia bacterium]